MKKNISGKCCNLRVIKVASLALVIVTCFACKQQEQQHNPQFDYVYTQRKNRNVKEIGMLQDSMKQGLWIGFYPNGKIEYISFYKDNKQHGPQRYFYEDGTLSIHYEMYNGLTNGHNISFYRNGQLNGIHYSVNDTIGGLLTSYEYDGTLDYIHEYNKGKYVRTIAGNEPLAIQTEEDE